MRLTKGLRRLARQTAMLGIEWARHGKGRGFAYAAVGASAAVVLYLCLADASSMSMTSRPTIQRATAGSW